MNDNVVPNATEPILPQSDLLCALIDRIEALDKAGAVRLALGAVESGRIGVADLYTQVLGPFLTGVGAQWQHGRERVWQEHYASHTVRTIVEALYPTVTLQAAAVQRRGETVLLVCPPKEEHELGLRMLSDRFELAGYRTVFIGADTPIAEIIEAASAVSADIVAMSVSTVFELVELRCFVDQVRAGLPGTRVVLGGAAFTREPGSWPANELLDPAALGLPGADPVR
jgi:MerR family transcriptional regulator, light-induced transcriptional regulator